MSSVFEAIMLLCFAASWPFSILKAIRTRLGKGEGDTVHVVIESRE